jgi:hypothetical protein
MGQGGSGGAAAGWKAVSRPAGWLNGASGFSPRSRKFQLQARGQAALTAADIPFSRRRETTTGVNPNSRPALGVSVAVMLWRAAAPQSRQEPRSEAVRAARVRQTRQSR